ncbi:LCP family glycopolymer transferase [Paenibacillus nasutitermitis]|uniref:Transcriptional regulator LytR n=1 Tax=Paenibacillus nasutitermitis TaxID=1652958 RepID=A0A917DW17_9BACL|nr:LCP family protein [Paenibacillus nasutitermitis]GGD75982.1 transcriptional regulator LytR [Paenibacillus nasutitermitis]
MKRRTKKILIWSGSAVFAVLLLGGGIVWYLYHSVHQVADKIYEKTTKPVYVSKDPGVKKDIEPIFDNLDAFNILVLGVDQRENDSGRSDTMIVLTVNPAKNSILMFNIPRDTRTEIVGHGTVDKINHAYAFGGVEMSIQTVENFLDYPIDYYMKVNMEGFERLIDLVGGVKVNNPYTFKMQGHEFVKGQISLNGKEALLYSRMRYDDPRGDLGRNARQREILIEGMKSSLSLSNIVKVQGLLDEVGDSVKSNITFEDMKTFLTDYRPHIDKIDSVEIKGKGETINGIWYYIVPSEEKNRIHEVMKAHLQENVESAPLTQATAQ